MNNQDIIKFSKINNYYFSVNSTATNIAYDFKHIKFLTIRPHGGTFSALHQVYDETSFLKRFKELLHLTFSNYKYVGSIEKNTDIGYHFHCMIDISIKNLDLLKDLNLHHFDVLHKYKMKQYCWKNSKTDKAHLIRGITYFLGFNTTDGINYHKKRSYTQCITNCKDAIINPNNINIKQYVDTFILE
jgi:hypothetical protein